MNKIKMTQEQRRLTSKLCKLISEGEFIRGNLTERMITCGNPNCKCAKGDKHKTLYLSVSISGKVRQIFIPRSLVKDVTSMVGRYKEIRDILESLCEIMLQDVLKRKE